MKPAVVESTLPAGIELRYGCLDNSDSIRNCRFGIGSLPGLVAFRQRRGIRVTDALTQRAAEVALLRQQPPELGLQLSDRLPLGRRDGTPPVLRGQDWWSPRSTLTRPNSGIQRRDPVLVRSPGLEIQLPGPQPIPLVSGQLSGAAALTPTEDSAVWLDPGGPR